MQKTKQKQAKGKAMQKDVAVKSSAAVGSHTQMSEWGAPDISQKMILIPKIMVMQLTSKKVIAGEAVFGDFISSLDGTKIGSFKEPLDIIPIYLYEMWAEFTMIEKNKKIEREFKRMVKVDAHNDNWPFQDKDESGKPLERDRVANLYCLLPGDVAKGGELPFLISFRSTSRIAGRKIATQMYALNPGSGKSPAAKVFKLRGEKKEGKQGAWIQLDASVERDSTATEELSALKWYKAIMASQTKVEHDDFIDDAREETKDVPKF